MAVESAQEECRLNGKIALSAGALRATGDLQRGDLPTFKKSFQQLCDSPCRSVLVDLKHCRRLSSRFIGEMADAVMRMQEGGKEVHVEVSPEIGKLLHLARIYCLFDYDISAAEIS